MQITNKGIFAFITGYHALLVILFWPFLQVVSWPAWVFFFASWGIASLSITVGYHRLFSHRTYQAHPVWEWATLLGSTLALQWSALVWSHDHRLHHTHVDTDKDPYSIKKGFWYAHMLWLFDYKPKVNPALVPDLMQNPRVVFQDRHFLALALATNFGLFFFGCLFMHPLASFVGTFLLRVFAVHHTTWFINSLAHTFGSRTYARELSAVDNALLALLTFGEGYHNYHHAFANDYRNGIRWWHFDPSKWIIWLGSRVGLTRGLRTVQRLRLQRTLVNLDRQIILERLGQEFDELSAELRDKLIELAETFEANAQLLGRRLLELKKASSDRRHLLQADVRRLRSQLSADWRAWCSLTALAARRYRLAH